VKAVPKGFHRELTHCISIIIGTVPLWQSACPQQALPAPTAPPSAPVAAYTDTRKFNSFAPPVSMSRSADNSKLFCQKRKKTGQLPWHYSNY
jgi:hypothetical protein